MRQRINVLVLVLISMLAGGLVMPAIQAWRDFAKRSEGLCRFAAIGLAAHNHNDCHGSLPPGTLPHPTLPPEDRLSWMVALLPYIDQDELYRQINKEEGWSEKRNREAAQMVIVTYLCAANPDQPEAGRPAPTHYVGMAGVGLNAASLPVDSPRAGVFGHDRVVRIPADIPDGQSNTILIIDTAALNGPWASGGPATVREFLPGIYPCVGTNRQFGGAYRGYARVALADASSRTVNESISARTFERICTIADGQFGPSDW